MGGGTWDSVFPSPPQTQVESQMIISWFSRSKVLSKEPFGPSESRMHSCTFGQVVGEGFAFGSLQGMTSSQMITYVGYSWTTIVPCPLLNL